MHLRGTRKRAARPQKIRMALHWLQRRHRMGDIFKNFSQLAWTVGKAFQTDSMELIFPAMCCTSTEDSLGNR